MNWTINQRLGVGSVKEKSRRETMRENSTKIFPINLGYGLLDSSDLSKVKTASKEVVDKVITEIDGTVPYRPLAVLQTFEKIDGYNCVGCSPSRFDGLKLEPKLMDDCVFDEFKFPSRMGGFNRIVHGGFIMLAIDELMEYAVVLLLGKLGFTTELHTHFKQPDFVEKIYRLEARIKAKSTSVTVEAQILDSKKPVVMSEGKHHENG